MAPFTITDLSEPFDLQTDHLYSVVLSPKTHLTQTWQALWNAVKVCGSQANNPEDTGAKGRSMSWLSP